MKRGTTMEKKKMVQTICEKIETKKFNDHGIMKISVDDLGDNEQILDSIKDLKADTSYEFDLKADEKILEVYNKDDDLEGFRRRNPSPQKCQ